MIIEAQNTFGAECALCASGAVTAGSTERRTFDLWPEVGRMLGLSRPSTYAAAKNGQIPTIRIGGRILVPRAALEKLLAGE